MFLSFLGPPSTDWGARDEMHNPCKDGTGIASAVPGRIIGGEQGEQKTGGIRYYCCYGRESEMEGGGSSQGLDLWVAASGPAPCGAA